MFQVRKRKQQLAHRANGNRPVVAVLTSLFGQKCGKEVST